MPTLQSEGKINTNTKLNYSIFIIYKDKGKNTSSQFGKSLNLHRGIPLFFKARKIAESILKEWCWGILGFLS